MSSSGWEYRYKTSTEHGDYIKSLAEQRGTTVKQLFEDGIELVKKQQEVGFFDTVNMESANKLQQGISDLQKIIIQLYNATATPAEAVSNKRVAAKDVTSSFFD